MRFSRAKAAAVATAMILATVTAAEAREVPYRRSHSPYIKNSSAYFHHISPGYAEKTQSAFTHGLKNLALGWTELVTQPAIAQARGDNVLTGTAYGIKNAFVRTVGGALESVSAPITAALPEP